MGASRSARAARKTRGPLGYPGPPGPHGPFRPSGTPAPPAAPLAKALAANESLASLLARLAESHSRWAVVAPLLAADLAAAARAGPLDDKVWVILAEHAAAAAKLRQCLPDIEAALSAQGWLTPPVKIKVRPRGL